MSYIRLGAWVLAVAAVVTLYSMHELQSLTHTAYQVTETGLDSSRSALLGSGRRNLPAGSASTTAKSKDTQTLPLPSGAEGQSALALETFAFWEGAPPNDIIGGGQCVQYPHTDLWGDALIDGRNFRAGSAGECCKACLDLRRSAQGREPDEPDCNVWVWCGEKEGCGEMHQQCWLKWLPYARVSVPKDASLNASVPWTSGTSIDLDLSAEIHGWKLKNSVKGRKRSREAQESLDPTLLPDVYLYDLKKGVREPQMYHTVTSVSGLYNQWQTRIHYYHWLKVKRRCLEDKEAAGKRGVWSPPCEMGGFTRLLHSGKPDNIMQEIPTVVVDPMPADMLKHDDYVVLNRPYAFLEWVKIAKIPEKYVLMSEPDHIWLRAIPNFMRGDRPAAFNFGYMNPAGREDCSIIKRLIGIPTSPECEQVAPIGNSPTFFTLEDMKKVMPFFLNMSMVVYKDAEAKKVWGWCQEMYAFAMAVYLAGFKQIDLVGHLVAQPPFDPDFELKPGRPFYILHYTYGLDFNASTGEVMMKKVGDWHFDKRFWDPTPIPRNMEEPPDTVDFPLGRAMIRSFNEATDAIPCWDDYHRSHGNRTREPGCKEKPKGIWATTIES